MGRILFDSRMVNILMIFDSWKRDILDLDDDFYSTPYSDIALQNSVETSKIRLQ